MRANLSRVLLLSVVFGLSDYGRCAFGSGRFSSDETAPLLPPLLPRELYPAGWAGGAVHAEFRRALRMAGFALPALAVFSLAICSRTYSSKSARSRSIGHQIG